MRFDPAGGSLEVDIASSDAVTAGAQWQVDGYAWQASGTTLSGLSVGSHTVSFKPLNYWISPASQSVTITSGNTSTVSGVYYKYDFAYTASGTNVTITGYAGSASDVTIPSTVPNVGTVSVIGNSAFQSCSKLTSVTIPNTVNNIGDSAFSGCESLTNVTIPNSVTNIGEHAFEYCISLTSITIPDRVSSIRDGTFEGCRELTNVTIPNSVASIGDGAFNCCINLTGITIPNSVTNIGQYAFKDCISLTSITIPEGVTSIRNSAFMDCSSLTNVTIPNSLVSIESYAFNYCSSLASVTIPKGVTNIEDFAFAEWSSSTLGAAFFQGDAPSLFGSEAFYGAASSFTIYYPATASGWSTPIWNGYAAMPYALPPVLSLARSGDSFTPSFAQLTPGTNFQLQVSTDLKSWSNCGAAFMATDTNQSGASLFGLTNNALFFRLKTAQ